MPACPSCTAEIAGRDISDKTSIKPYRTCPECGTRFTVDPRTKQRQAVALAIALTSLALTIGWCFLDQPWLIPTATSYVVLTTFIVWSNNRVQYVAYR